MVYIPQGPSVGTALAASLTDHPATLPATTNEIMRRRILNAPGALLFAALAILAASAAVAQQDMTLTISSRTLEVENFLRQGRQLEFSGGGAKRSRATKTPCGFTPDEQSLERRFESARLHYDLGRRYADRSFCRSLTELSPQQALDLYAGVLLKIQTHYVEEPNWRNLVACGASDFEEWR